MPELPEVETTCRGIAPHIKGRRVTQVQIRNGRLRWPVEPLLPAILPGQLINAVGRRGKYILVALDQGHLIVHLGMSGSLRLAGPTEIAKKHDHVDIILDDGQLLRYHDPRRFGSIHWTTAPVDEHWLLSGLGKEPLADDFDGDYLFRLSRKKSQAVKLFIMDSHIVTGVGNIYANEALFMAGIRPQTAAGRISRQRYQRLAVAITEILENAIRQGGTTLRDFVNSNGAPGYFRQELSVYGRKGEPCHKCERPLSGCVIGQRATYYCNHCQH